VLTNVSLIGPVPELDGLLIPSTADRVQAKVVPTVPLVGV